MLILDSNIIAALLVPTVGADVVPELLQRAPVWGVPELWRHELTSILLKYVRASLMTLEEAQAALQETGELMAPREFTVDPVDALGLAERSGCSSYDAEFVCLAQSQNAILVTYDRQLLRLFPERCRTPEQVLASGA